MKYFNTLPLVYQTDFNGNSVVVNNLLTRSYILPSLKNNIMLYYEYNINETDTPENIAYKYYKDIDRYWILLYSNNIIDPQAEWPLTNQQFLTFLNDKYASATATFLNIPVASVTQSQVLAYTSAKVHHYEKTVTTFDSSNLQKQAITIQIDESTYNGLMETTVTSTFPSTGVKVTKITEKAKVSFYSYEQQINEDKRKINLMKDSYVSATEQQFKTLMSR